MTVLDPSVLPTAPPWKAVIAQATTTTTTPAPGPILDVRGSGAVVVIVAIGLALAFLWFVPWWVDSRRAYRLRERAIDLVGGRLLDAVRTDTTVKIGDLRDMLVTIGEVATSPVETARALMSFILITIVGVALAALLLSSAGDASDLRKTLLSSILTLLGTIVGFYFGTRAAESTSAPRTPPLPSAPAGEGAPSPGSFDAAPAVGMSPPALWAEEPRFEGEPQDESEPKDEKGRQ